MAQASPGFFQTEDADSLIVRSTLELNNRTDSLMTTTRRTKPRGCKFWLIVAGASFVVVVAAFVARYFPWYANTTISGVVVDESSQRPIPNAKVIVTLQRYGIPYNFMVAKYALITDDSGQFFLDRPSPKRFNDVFVEASTPSNGYGSITVSGRADDVVINAAPLTPVLQKYGFMKYEHFAGGAPYMGVKELEFINDRWSVQLNRAPRPEDR